MGHFQRSHRARQADQGIIGDERQSIEWRTQDTLTPQAGLFDKNEIRCACPSHVSLVFSHLSVANLHAFLYQRLGPSAGHKVREGAAIWFRGAVLVRLSAYV